MALEVQPSAHGRAGRGTQKVASLAPEGRALVLRFAPR